MTQEHLGEYETRLKKLQHLKEAGIVPYANSFRKSHSCVDLQQLGEKGQVSDAEILLASGSKKQYATAGRMMMFRTHGKLSFATLRDSTGDIQIAFVKDLCNYNTGKTTTQSLSVHGEDFSSYTFVQKFIDVGDFVGVHGELFITKHGELTLFVNEYQLLSKTLRPLGDKWHGIKDEEKIYRQRYLDMTMNESSYQRFLFKTKFYTSLREFYVREGFQEIVTSILGNAASGAAAKPFKTHHNDFDLDVYLRIAFEPGLKMATAGRYEKVFEIGKDFRNEGSDPSHLQEFTQVEHYAAYWNYSDNMEFTQKIFDFLFEKLDLPTIIPIKDKDGKICNVDWSTPWEKIDYIQGVKKASGGIDITQYSLDDADKLRQDIQKLGLTWPGMETQSTATLIDYLYKKVLRPTIIGPAFVFNYPKTMQPLARQSDTNHDIVEQFQVVVNGREIIKAYSELVDPTIQAKNFDDQADASAKGDNEATSGDYDFLLAMEHGMPPQSGFGMGIERIIALLTGQENLRDVVMFPLMKPQSSHTHDENSINENNEDQPQIVKDLQSDKDSTSTQGKETNNRGTEKVGSLESVAIENALKLVNKYLSDTKRHCQQVAHVMKYFANELGEDEEYRYVVGLLHDVDWDYIKKDPSRHLGSDFDSIALEGNLPQHMIDDIKSHYDKTGIPVDNTIRKYLISIDELSGLLYAYSLMRPEGYVGMSWKSINKKIKDKAFASGVNRDHVRYCEEYLGMPLAEFSLKVVDALKSFND